MKSTLRPAPSIANQVCVAIRTIGCSVAQALHTFALSRCALQQAADIQALPRWVHF